MDEQIYLVCSSICNPIILRGKFRLNKSSVFVSLNFPYAKFVPKNSNHVKTSREKIGFSKFWSRKKSRSSKKVAKKIDHIKTVREKIVTSKN